mmetsp:Transcript_95694/g.270847  ORF Transcript_95694/g.270847 Transcript_95694/m.270847 type:complete len:369 (-) Transcript_95694:140-1246(-)
MNITSLDVMYPSSSRSHASCSMEAACFCVTMGVPGKLAERSATPKSSKFHFGDLRRAVALNCSSAATQLPERPVAHFLKVARTSAILMSTSWRLTEPSSSTSMAFQSATTSPTNPIFRHPFRSSVFEMQRLPSRSSIFRKPRMKLPPDTARTFCLKLRIAASCALRMRRLRCLICLAVALAASRSIWKLGSSTACRLRAFGSRKAMSFRDTEPTPSRSSTSWKTLSMLPSKPSATQAPAKTLYPSDVMLWPSPVNVLNMATVPAYLVAAHLWNWLRHRSSSGESSRSPMVASPTVMIERLTRAPHSAEASPGQARDVKAWMNSEKNISPPPPGSSTRRQAFRMQPCRSVRKSQKASMIDRSARHGVPA